MPPVLECREFVRQLLSKRGMTKKDEFAVELCEDNGSRKVYTSRYPSFLFGMKWNLEFGADSTARGASRFGV